MGLGRAEDRLGGGRAGVGKQAISYKRGFSTQHWEIELFDRCVESLRWARELKNSLDEVINGA